MCSSDKQNMAEGIENLLDIARDLLKKWKPVSKNKGKESEKKRRETEEKIKKIGEEIENKRKELETLVKDLRDSIGQGSSDLTSLVRNVDLTSMARNVVDLSVMGLTEGSLTTFWGTLAEFHNLTRLGVAVTDKFKLPDSKVIPEKLKEKLTRLRIEGELSELENLSAFRKLNHLTLASHKKMETEKIPDLGELLCLRLYGVCDKENCTSDVCKNETGEFKLKLLCKLNKLVIGNMGKVKTVRIGYAVLSRVATLKFSDLPKLKEVKYTEKQHPCVSWQNKTIILRNSGDFNVAAAPGLEIYKYNQEMQCYRLKAT